MAVNIKDLKGQKIKKFLNAEKCFYRWHNKNSRGGNFGIEIHFADSSKDTEINGNYDTEGNLYPNSVVIGDIYWARSKIPLSAFENIDTFMDYVKEFIREK